MKLSFFILVFSLLKINASVYSQSTKISLYLEDVTVENVFSEIKGKTEFKILFLNSEIDLQRKVSITIKKKRIEKVLSKLFNNTNIVFEIVGKQIVLRSDNSMPITQLKTTSDHVSTTNLLQQQEIKGKILDANNIPLTGVNILVKGTSRGTQTDFDGNYSINVANGETLVISFIGFATQEVVIGSETNSKFNIILQEDTAQLDEVVVVGYGTQKRRDLTGSIVSLDLSDKASTTNVNLGQALQGFLPGVNVGISASAGEAPSISVRGRTSLSGSDNPLIVLDGIIFNGSLTDININDVKKLDVLKDASAAAVYGSRSANGVILITTKSGKRGKSSFNLNVYSGFQHISPSDGDNVMNGEQFMTRLVDYAYQSQQLYPWYATNPTDASGRPVRPDPTDPNVVTGVARSTEEFENWLAGNEINWLDEALKSSAVIQNYDLSVSGGSEKTKYFISGSFINQDGLTLGDNFKRATFRANFENDITDWLKFGVNSSYAFRDNSGIAADINEALQGSPWANFILPNGRFPIDLAGESFQRHPLSNTVADNLDERNNIFLSAKLQVKIPWIEGLGYEISYSNSFDSRRNFSFFPSFTLGGSNNNGRATRQHVFNKNWIVNNIVTYNRTFADKHAVNVTLLGSREKRTFSTSTLSGTDFSISALGFENIGLAGIENISSTADEENNLAYMARLNYAFDSRYLLTATIRRDGFSGFSPNNKTATFKSASLAWVLSDENFLNNSKWVDYLKLRVSYGENGNQDVGRFGSFARAQTRFTVFDNQSVVGYRPNTLGNVDLRWETTKSFNFGLDFKLLDNKISGTVDVYHAKTEDVLFTRSVPRATGFSSILENIGETENKGIEIGLNTVNINANNFKWESRFNFSLNRNKLVKIFGGENDFDIGNSLFSGEPISSFYGYNNLGVVYTEEEFFNGDVPDGFFPGHFKIEDLDNSGDLTADADRKVLGTPDPNYRFGITNTLTYKNFSFSFFLNSIQGGGNRYLGNASGLLISGGTDFVRRNNVYAIRPYWRPDAPTTNAPGIFHSPSRSGALLQSRSFVRLQDISLGYTLPSKTLNKIGFKNMRLYLSGKNIITWTKWPGWDPEIVGRNTPITRSLILGINTSF